VCTIDHIELVVITGCSSGLGRETVKNLLATDKYHVIGAVRDVDKMEAVAEIDGLNMNNFHIMDCELNSFASVHKFCEDLKEYQLAKPIDRLICNAGGKNMMYRTYTTSILYTQ
jgi:NADP-dependent 3-hydroxy acid dehydrogenase YdfG